MYQWHVAITKPFSELIAERHLDQQAFQAFSPKCLIARVVRNRRVITEKPYFGGYIFVNFDPAISGWQSINSTRGIHSLIYAAPEKPAVVPANVMQVLLDRCNGGSLISPDIIDQHIAKLVPLGATVRVNGGPFEGFTGPVTWTDAQRVAVLLSFLGTARKIKIPAASVEVIGSRA